mgnify:CR=1 FL=1
MLLDSSNFSHKLHQSIRTTKSTLLIASAFIKLGALSKLSFLDESIDVIVISRWQKHDLLCGASDIEVYNFCKSKGWKFGISLNFHGKLYLIDKKEIYLGSANFTLRGLNLADICNIEFGTVIPVERTDLVRIDQFLRTEISWIDDHKFHLIEKEFLDDKTVKQPLPDTHWSIELASTLTTAVEYLWVHELIFNTPDSLLALNLNDESHIHDYEILGLDIDSIDARSIKNQFKRTRLCSWVYSQLAKNNEMNFGAFSHALHNALLDDPIPYRKEVKEFVAVLFEWFKFIDEEFHLTQFRKTASVRLKNEGKG